MEELGRFVDFEKLPDVRFGSVAACHHRITRTSAYGQKRTCATLRIIGLIDDADVGTRQ